MFLGIAELADLHRRKMGCNGSMRPSLCIVGITTAHTSLNDLFDSFIQIL